VALVGGEQEKELNDGQGKRLKIQIMALFYPLREIYMHFLLTIDEDFDDDLLQDAITCLIE
jgi:hypothetical protein